jgi:filamentous hemagglutinin
MTKTLRIAKNFLAQFAIIALILEQFLFVSASSARAADLPITPDGSTNTQIDRAANNVPIVNIAAPNSGGLSHNKFTDYNVNQNGLILNNAIGSQNGIAQTQIGGLINDNANLKNSGAASVILNEVTSNNISQINGYTEIAGKKADLILANPNGIQMNGAGFINVSRFSAVIGSANQFNPNPSDLTFSLSGNAFEITHGFLPKLTISGAGIDLENITSTDLVANVMNIVAPIYGGSNDVNLRTGDQTFNYLTKAVTSDNSTPGSNLPSEVAIDASALGKIQAGRIFIVATKEGFGIKYSGDLLASRSGVTIDNQGNIDYNNIASEIGDISVTSQKGSITQNGISQTQSVNDITLSAFGDINNYGQFVSANNINLTTSATLNNQSTALSLSENDFTITAVDFANLGKIAANRDLSITAATLTNSAQLVAARNLTLTAPQITNDDSIYAGNKIAITANNYLTNNKDIISLGLGLTDETADDGILINAKTLNNNQQIAAKNNITINSDALNNNTATSSILALNDINLNLTSIDNSAGSIQALNNLTLRNLTLNAPTIASNFAVTSEATTITNLNGTFFAGSLLDFDLGNLANYTITGTLESVGNIKIKANDITNQSNLQANGYIKIDAADKFTNGVLSGDNSNTKIVAGTYLDITAANLLSNYGTLSSGTNLILTSTSGNINNNIDAEIIGGAGTLTLSAKSGTVNQNSLHSLVSNGDLTLDVVDFDNTGRVDIAGDFTLNVANNLTNEAGALIYSGGNMELNVVNNLTNNIGAVIYSEGNLTIQKYATSSSSYNATNNKTNLIDNISAEITSYAGNVNLYAATLNNRRSSNKTQGAEIRWSSGCNYHHHECHYNSYASKSFSGTEGNTSYIKAGNNLTIGADTFLNDASNILSVGTIEITANNLNNNTQKYESYTKQSIDWWQGNQDSNLNGAALQNYVSETYSGLIKAGGSITLTSPNNISNTTATPNSGPSIVSSQVTSKDSQLVNSLDVGEITSNGTISIDITGYLNGPDNQGLFTKNTNPNGPLFETRSEFLDQSQFFGSDYFYTRIGLNLTDVQTEFEQTSKRLVGDQFFQNKIISEQLATISKNSLLLSASGTNANNEIKDLLDNAADEYARLGLTTNQSLTQTQINSLQKDIVWFETQTIDGATYIVPKIYLTQATKDNLKNNLATGATIYAGADINLNSTGGKITNQGSITGNNVTLSASGDILNKNFSNITALNSLSLTSSAGAISNFSQIKAGGALSLSAAKDITNSSTVLTNDANLLSSGIVGYASNSMSTTDQRFINSTTLETAGITAGSLTANAGGSFNNLAANITTSGNAQITAGKDVNIATLELRNRSESRWGSKKKGGSEIIDTTTNVASNVNVGGNLNVTTTGLAADSATDGGSDINVVGSNISATGNLTLASKDEVNIISAEDSYFKTETSHKKGLTHSSSSTSIKSSTTNVSSDISAGGDVVISSGKDTNILASNISGESNGTIVAGSYIDYDPTSLTYGQTIINNDAQVNILNGKDITYTFSETIKTKMSFNVQQAIVGTIVGGVFLGLAAGIKKDTRTTTAGSTTETIVKSNLSFKDNLSIASASDLTIKSSDLTTTRGDISLTSGTNINILADSENNSSYQHGSSNGLFGSNKQRKTDVSTTTNVSSIITAGTDQTSSDGNLDLISVENTALQAAKLNANKDITITAGDNLSLLVATNSSSVSYTNNDETTFNFTNGSSGFFKTEIINNEILAGANSSSGGSAGNVAINVGGNILAQYNAKSGEVAAATTQGINESSLTRDFSATPELAYINALNPTQTQYQSLDEISKSWDQTGRGLTETGTAVVAVAAVVVTVVTLGAAAPIAAGFAAGGWAAVGATAAVAAGSAAAATASTSAVNASMNADGDPFKQLKTIHVTAFKDTTSEESLKNIAISAVAAAATAGLMQGLDSITTASTTTASATTTTASTTTTATASTTTTAATSTASTTTSTGTLVASNSSSLLSQAGRALAESAISTVSSTAAQSAINGDSFSEAIKHQGVNILIGALGNLGAKQIGQAAHGTTTVDSNGNVIATTSGTISKPTQYILHAGLGCAMSGLSGGDCASGAVSGMVGELAGESLRSSVENGSMAKQTATQLAGLAGGYSSIITGQFSGQNDHEVAQNIWSGSRIGSNAAENNALGDSVIRVIATAPAAAIVGKGDVKEGYRKIGEDLNTIKDYAGEKFQEVTDSLYGKYPDAMSTLGSGLEVADKYFATPTSNALNYPVTQGIQGVNYLADNISGQQNYLASNGYDQNFWTGLGVTSVAAIGTAATVNRTAYNYYTNKVDSLDVSTARNAAVFYSGEGNKILAKNFAVTNGKTTLEMTPGGSWLDQKNLFRPNTSLISNQQATHVWSQLSQRYAEGASGSTVGFVNGARPNAIFNTTEYPALIKNPNITNIITNIPGGN